MKCIFCGNPTKYKYNTTALCEECELVAEYAKITLEELKKSGFIDAVSDR